MPRGMGGERSQVQGASHGSLTQTDATLLSTSAATGLAMLRGWPSGATGRLDRCRPKPVFHVRTLAPRDFFDRGRCARECQGCRRTPVLSNVILSTSIAAPTVEHCVSFELGMGSLIAREARLVRDMRAAVIIADVSVRSG